MHDDIAIQRLLNSRAWSEFPLLKEFLPCLSSGAMKADYWRYLVTWAYGGLYTDIDNAPGRNFNNGTLITDHDDAFFEVELGGFPSQYFYAVSPRHPVSYFMLSSAIERLLKMSSNLSKRRLAPQITGPGACKTGIIGHIGGNGYNPEGTYTGVSNRQITIFGNSWNASNGDIILRGSVEPNEEILSQMNMSHYHHNTKERSPTHSCLAELHSQVILR